MVISRLRVHGISSRGLAPGHMNTGDRLFRAEYAILLKLKKRKAWTDFVSMASYLVFIGRFYIDIYSSKPLIFQYI
jgi:hypothetical protein